MRRAATLRAVRVAASLDRVTATSILLLAALSASPPSATSRAEALIRKAIVEFDGGEFDDALVHAREAYDLQPVPGLLYNLGQCHRALHHWEQAAHEFKAYLRKQPDARNRAGIEALIKEMEKNRREQLAGQTPTPSPIPPWAPPEAPPASMEAPPTPPPAEPAPKPKQGHIAVLDIRPHGSVSQDIAQGVTSVTVLDVRKLAAGAVVVGADEIRAMMGLERQKQLLGCTESSCLAEIGGALGAERLVLGTLSHFGDTYVLDVKLLDSRTAKVLAEGSKDFKQEGEIPGAVAQSVSQLFPAATPSEAAAVDTSPRPELTQEAAPSHRAHALAWTLFASTAVAAGFAIYGAVKVVNEQDALNGLTATTPESTYLSTLGAKPNAQNWEYAAYVLGGVALAAAVGGAFTW
jgi:tetratricopeptide (TPR) repeat protein